MNEPDEKMQKKMNKLLRVTLFTSFFFHMFFPLVLIGVICLVIGLFKPVFLAVGGIFLVLDAVLSLAAILHFNKMQSKNPEYERFRQAMTGANPYEGLNKLTDEWAGEEFFRARLELYSEEAQCCKTVREAFSVYKEHAGSFLGPHLFFEVSVKTEEYFRDGKKHFVISFDRQREVNDDVIVHMWFDLLYEPGTVSETLNETIRCEDYLKIDDYFSKVEAFLEANDLMNLPVKETDIGTDE